MPTKSIKLFNTLTRSIESIKPLVPGKIGIYCCGPTVYNFQHIGNLKTYIVEDVLVRTLRYGGYDVNHVMNITDVGHLVSDADEGEDKMLVAMKRENKRSHDIAEYYTKIFFDDCDKLHIKRPDIVCKATEHIQEMIDLIRRIEANGLAYFAGGNVYFDVSKCRDYGKLAKLDLESLQAGARIDVDPNKRSPFDFVLWFTKSKFENQELVWDSPWGRGYPGWHIECSAMSIKYLGDQFDIHCGGIDHIPVHHTNEIAQSEAATQKPWVNVWIHSDFMVINREKMSKSKGGFITLKDLIEKGTSPEAFRYFCLTASYRQQLNFGPEALEGATASTTRLRNTVISLKASCGDKPADKLSATAEKYLLSFEEAIFNDINTPQALAVIWNIVGDNSVSATEKLSLLYKIDDVLGLGVREWEEESVEISSELASLLSERERFRKEKNWKEADRIRDEITAKGFVIVDSAGGARLKRA